MFAWGKNLNLITVPTDCIQFFSERTTLLGLFSSPLDACGRRWHASALDVMHSTALYYRHTNITHHYNSTASYCDSH